MKGKDKKIFNVLVLLALAYFFWLSVRPVEIIAVHEKREYSSVLVRNFPGSDRRKITWWLKNKEMLKSRYAIPKPASDGSFTITFWDFGDGYQKAGKYDRYCFDDMKTDENCIDKNFVFDITDYNNNKVYFGVNDGRYLLKDNGEIIKINRE